MQLSFFEDETGRREGGEAKKIQWAPSVCRPQEDSPRFYIMIEFIFQLGHRLINYSFERCKINKPWLTSCLVP